MKRTIRMTLDVEFEDQSVQEREQAAINMECPVDDVPGAADVSATELAEMIADSLPINEELFGGSGMYITITKARGFNAGDQA